MEHKFSNVFAYVFVFVALISIKSYEACRSTPGDHNGRKKHLLLPSLWTPVTPPGANPGTNSALAGAKNFAGLRPAGKNSIDTLLLPSMKWGPVIPPGPNPGTNSAVVGAKNFAAAELLPRKKSINTLLLPSMKWRPVTPPSRNPGHNGAVGTVSEQNFSREKTIIVHPPSEHHNPQGHDFRSYNLSFLI